MKEIKRFYIDYNKLKEEDRRFILNYHNERIMSYKNLALLVTAVLISLLAVLISSYLIIDNIKNIYNYIIGNIIYVLLLIGLILISKRVQDKIEKLRLEHEKKHNRLYMFHFKYAIKDERK